MSYGLLYFLLLQILNRQKYDIFPKHGMVMRRSPPKPHQNLISFIPAKFQGLCIIAFSGGRRLIDFCRHFRPHSIATAKQMPSRCYTLAILMPQCSHTLKYGKSMATLWQEYGIYMLRVCLIYENLMGRRIAHPIFCDNSSYRLYRKYCPPPIHIKPTLFL